MSPDQIVPELPAHEDSGMLGVDLHPLFVGTIRHPTVEIPLPRIDTVDQITG